MVSVAPVVTVTVSRVAPLAIALSVFPEILFPKTSCAVAVTVTDVPAGAESTPVTAILSIKVDVPCRKYVSVVP